jgi:predicted amidohydrolase
MPLVRARMIEQGEDFHIAVFPGAFALHTGPRLEEPDVEGHSFWGHTLTRAHAMEAGCFVLSACGYMRQEDFPRDFPLLGSVNAGYAHGGSQIVAPLGIPLAPPTSGDTILYADCQADMIKVWKAIIDTTGHYARPDVVRLSYLAGRSAFPHTGPQDGVAHKTGSAAEAVGEKHETGKQPLDSAAKRAAGHE